MVVASLIINGIVNAFSSFFAITLNILTILAHESVATESSCF